MQEKGKVWVISWTYDLYKIWYDLYKNVHNIRQGRGETEDVPDRQRPLISKACGRAWENGHLYVGVCAGPWSLASEIKYPLRLWLCKPEEERGLLNSRNSLGSEQVRGPLVYHRLISFIYIYLFIYLSGCGEAELCHMGSLIFCCTMWNL